VQASGRGVSRRASALGSLARLLAAAALLSGACTLTRDEYSPPLVEQQPLEPDAGSVIAPSCSQGESCCEALPCPPGQRCEAGACVLPSPDAGACVGADCPGPVDPVPLAPSCDDSLQNGDETGTDCGGSCPSRCAVGTGCRTDVDCAEGAFCEPGSSECASVSCGDELRNGAESDVDCGGPECPDCADGESCGDGADCASGVCGPADTCSAPACGDGALNGTETGVDCGGSCPFDCDDGVACRVGADCQSRVCDDVGCGPGLELCCQEPSCSDGVQNGGEPVTDCGNAACEPCPTGSPCFLNAHCESNACLAGTCANPPSCTDGVQNGSESSADCGGSCARCPDRRTCNVAADCINNNCDPFGICISCGDGVLDGTETGIDCGGADPFCRRCNPGEACANNTDCLSQFCLGGFCA
jgi:hypothetical protein